MALRICTYNVEWFDHLFNDDNTMKTGANEQRRFHAIRDVLQAIGADLIGVVEAPNTSADRTQSTVVRLETFANWAGISTTKAIVGTISAGGQELALLWDPAKFDITHQPGGKTGSRSNPPFTGEFYFDTDDDRIFEAYKFYRPPLEAQVTVKGANQQFYLMLVHTKSKGIFNSVDLLHWQRESLRNRRKLYAECTWTRRRVDEWLDEQRDVIVMGDINDGPEMDYYEFQFGRSAVEIIMGSIFDPDRVLRNYAGQPKWTRYGWSPSSTRFEDQMTGKNVNVLIDHILISKKIQVKAGKPHKIWNPYEDDDAKPLKAALLEASDHFPVTLDLA
ncbi:MAG: endonuclease/exonuclease/phosphatase family protein [Nitrospinota bacterium]